MVAPAMIYVFVFAYMPMSGMELAFKKYNYQDGIFFSAWTGLDNFRFFFVGGKAMAVIRNTVLYNLAFIAIGIVLEVGVAVVLNEMRGKRLKKALQTGIFMPYFVSWVVAASIVLNIFGYEYGLLNGILRGLGAAPVNIYANPNAWPPLMIILKAWKSTGYGVVIYLAAITSLDQSMYEAADIDGASVWQKIRTITLPCLSPTIVILFLLACGSIFRGDFGLFYQIATDPRVRDVTEIIDTYIYRMLMTAPNVGMSAAGGMFQSIICFFFVLAANYTVRKIEPDYSLF
jgi:putative aldouronate transport system permease protein